MGVKWRDYLSRKGLSIEAWIDANGVSSVEGLRTRLDQLGIVLLPDDALAVEGVLRARANLAIAKVLERQRAEGVVPLPPTSIEPEVERPKKKRRQNEPAGE